MTTLQHDPLAAQIAARFQLTPAEVLRSARFAAAVDSIAEVSPVAKVQILDGLWREMPLAELEDVAALPTAERLPAVEEIVRQVEESRA